MQKHQLPFGVFETIVETADLWIVPAEESSDGDPDSVRIRKDYSGRAYSSGFGIIVESRSAFPRFLAAAGVVASQHPAEDDDLFDILAFARATATDSMGRSGEIIYWNGWEITDLPEEFTRD